MYASHCSSRDSQRRSRAEVGASAARRARRAAGRALRRGVRARCDDAGDRRPRGRCRRRSAASPTSPASSVTGERSANIARARQRLGRRRGERAARGVGDDRGGQRARSPSPKNALRVGLEAVDRRVDARRGRSSAGPGRARRLSGATVSVAVARRSAGAARPRLQLRSSGRYGLTSQYSHQVARARAWRVLRSVTSWTSAGSSPNGAVTRLLDRDVGRAQATARCSRRRSAAAVGAPSGAVEPERARDARRPRRR